MINAISSGMSSMSPPPMRGVQPGQGQDDLFTKVDTDQDGSLNESEVTSFVEKMSEMTGQSADTAEMMAMFDTDEDGSVSESEFSALRPQGPPPMMNGMADDPFTTADADSDGSLSETELSSFAETLSAMSGQTMDSSSMMTDLDADEDGLLSEDEFNAGKPQGPPPGGMPPAGGIGASESSDEESSGLLSSLDIDGDGTVSAEEFKLAVNTLIQEYMNQSSSTSSESGSSGSLLDLDA